MRVHKILKIIWPIWLKDSMIWHDQKNPKGDVGDKKFLKAQCCTDTADHGPHIIGTTFQVVQ